MPEIHTKLRGVSFGQRQENIKLLQDGFRLFPVHEKENPYDSNAILCYADSMHTKEIGHISAELAKDLVKVLQDGRTLEVFVQQVTGGKKKQSFGVNVLVRYGDDA